MTDLTPEHKLLCDVAAVKVHLDKYSRIEQRVLLGRVMKHLIAVVEAQRAPAQPQYMANCLRAGACHGQCESTACTNYGKDIVVRRCVEPKQDGIVYPEVERR